MKRETGEVRCYIERGFKPWREKEFMGLSRNLIKQ